MLTAPRIVRTERAVRPCLPITLPTSCGATRSLRTVFSSRSTDSTSTAAGSSTKARAISRTSSSTATISFWVIALAPDLHPKVGDLDLCANSNSTSGSPSVLQRTVNGNDRAHYQGEERERSGRGGFFHRSLGRELRYQLGNDRRKLCAVATPVG